MQLREVATLLLRLFLGIVCDLLRTRASLVGEVVEGLADEFGQMVAALSGIGGEAVDARLPRCGKRCFERPRPF
jgi:hypothetical protein